MCWRINEGTSTNCVQIPWAGLPFLIAGQCIVIPCIVHIIINIIIIVRYVARRRLSPLHSCRSPDDFLSAWMGRGKLGKMMNGPNCD